MTDADEGAWIRRDKGKDPQLDEATSLLNSPSLSEEVEDQKTRRAVISRGQLVALLLVYFVEPVSCTFIYPFIAKLVSGLPVVNGDPRRIGYYSGLFDSLPLLTEALAILHWGWLGDKYGRKLVLLCGTAGLSIATICFGFSKTLTTLFLSRALQGVLNANAGTIKTIFGEMTKRDTVAMARVFSFLPIVWTSGATLGPLLGGFLEHPSSRFPSFSTQFWQEYPYLLPCIAAASVGVLGFITTLLFVEDSRSPKYEVNPSKSYGSFESPPGSSRSLSPVSREANEFKPFQFTPTLVLTLINCALLVFLGTSFLALISLFLAAPIDDGGLGFQPSRIGMVLSILGISYATFQATFFARIHKKYDPKAVFTTAMVGFGPLYLCLPVMQWVARNHGIGWGIWALICLLVILYTWSYTGICCMFILITRASPGPEHLSTTNGLGQIMIASMGAIGPPLTTALFALTREHNLAGGTFVYAVMISISIVAVALSGFLDIEETEEK